MEPSNDSGECSTGDDANAVDKTSVDNNASATPPLNLDELESETMSILQKYGRPPKKLASPAISYPPKRGDKSRPWTSASSIINRRGPLRSTTMGSLNKMTNNNAAMAQRPFTSIDNKNDDGNLRNTISSALTKTKFDSVPSLLVAASLQNSPYQSHTSPVLKVGDKPRTPKRTTQLDNIRTPSDSISQIKSLALRDIKYTGFEKNTQLDKNAKKVEPLDPGREICFNCWSSGQANNCLIHEEKLQSSGGQEEQNLSMCSIWNSSYLRHKYRSEKLMSSSEKSLVYDKSLKQFTTREQPKHPIYQLTEQHIDRLNFTNQRRQNVQIWFKSFIKKLKDGKYECKRSHTSAQILLLRDTIKNMISVQKLSKEVKDQHPKAPVTGTTMRELLGQEQVLVEKQVVNVDGTEEKCKFVLAGPTPVPKQLYQARKYEPLPPTTFVLNGAKETNNDRLDFSTILSSSIQYATFSRKRTSDNMAVGGLSAQMIVKQQFAGRFPPQYKDFTCKYQSVIVPPSVDEETSSSVPTLEVPFVKLPYIRRELVTPLDSRLPPAIMIKTGLSPEDRHFFGLNRPEQTGEKEDFGFRTSTWYEMPSFDDTIDTTSFRPSESVATPNLPVLSALRTMKVDGTYPFCKEESRTNCVDDLYDFLLSDGSCSSNKLQMFTCVGSQQCGYYMQNGNSTLPIGRVITRVVRSWAFLQSEIAEDAIYDEEITPLHLGGVVLKNDRPRHANAMPSGVLMKNSRKQIREAILRRMPSDELDQVPIVQKECTTNLSIEDMSMSHYSNGLPQKKKPIRSSSLHSETSKAVQRKSSDNKQPGYQQKPKPQQIDHPSSSLSITTTSKKDDVAESISQVITNSLASFSSKPEDLIRLGMGIGASLGAQGFLKLKESATEQVEEECERMPVPIGGAQMKIESADPDGDLYSIIDNITIESCSSSEEESKLEYDTIHDDEDDVFDGGNIVSFSDPTPQGLLDVISSTRVGKKHVEYLSYTFNLNLPELRSIEPLKPRSMAEEWMESEYDPWSDGREATSSQFIRSLTQETKNWPKANRVDGTSDNSTAREFASLCTLCRHGKYRDLENTINEPSWSLPIDYCDDSGNTLLHIACQNGNKRIAKLCLRRGSKINTRNLNGNTPLHFAFGYGFGDLGEYLLSKGADDSVQNANNMTCYEGLDMDEL